MILKVLLLIKPTQDSERISHWCTLQRGIMFLKIHAPSRSSICCFAISWSICAKYSSPGGQPCMEGGTCIHCTAAKTPMYNCESARRTWIQLQILPGLRSALTLPCCPGGGGGWPAATGCITTAWPGPDGGYWPGGGAYCCAWGGYWAGGGTYCWPAGEYCWPWGGCCWYDCCGGWE